MLRRMMFLFLILNKFLQLSFTQQGNYIFKIDQKINFILFLNKAYRDKQNPIVFDKEINYRELLKFVGSNLSIKKDL
jgi:hypothetical protein